MTYGTVNGAFMGGASNPMADFIKNYGGSPEVIFHIDIVNMKLTTAFVHIFMEKDAVELISTIASRLLKLIKVGL